MGDEEDVVGANATNKARLHLRPFEGKNDARVTRDFCRKVTGYRAVARLSDEETAQAVGFAMLQGSAADEWYTALTEENPDAVETWGALEPLLMARFSPEPTASEKAAATDHCKMNRGEDVLQFLDRCRSTQLLLDSDVPADEKTQGNGAPYRRRYNAGILQLFLRGLREEGGLKSHVNGALGCTTLEQYKTAAVTYERHVTKHVKVTVAAVDEDDGSGDEADDDDEVEVANLKKKTKKKGGKASGQGNYGNSKGQGKSANNEAGGDKKRLCWTCRSPDHMNYQCPDNPKRKNGGKSGGGGGGGGEGKSAFGNFELDTVLKNLGMQKMMQMSSANPGANTAAVETVDEGYRPPFPPQYRSKPGANPGFY